MYELFTKSETDSEAKREHIWNTIEIIPAINTA
jgi:hypothetical protein